MAGRKRTKCRKRRPTRKRCLTKCMRKICRKTKRRKPKRRKTSRRKMNGGNGPEGQVAEAVREAYQNLVTKAEELDKEIREIFKPIIAGEATAAAVSAAINKSEKKNEEYALLNNAIEVLDAALKNNHLGSHENIGIYELRDNLNKLPDYEALQELKQKIVRPYMPPTEYARAIIAAIDKIPEGDLHKINNAKKALSDLLSNFTKKNKDALKSFRNQHSYSEADYPRDKIDTVLDELLELLELLEALRLR